MTTDLYTLVFTDGARVTAATEAEADALSAQHAARPHVTLLPDTDDDYVPPANPRLIAGLRATAIREARWWLTGLGYTEQDAAVMVGLMLTADDMDITRDADLTQWLRDNQADWPRHL